MPINLMLEKTIIIIIFSDFKNSIILIADKNKMSHWNQIAMEGNLVRLVILVK